TREIKHQHEVKRHMRGREETNRLFMPIFDYLEIFLFQIRYVSPQFWVVHTHVEIDEACIDAHHVNIVIGYLRQKIGAGIIMATLVSCYQQGFLLSSKRRHTRCALQVAQILAQRSKMEFSAPRIDQAFGFDWIKHQEPIAN